MPICLQPIRFFGLEILSVGQTVFNNGHEIAFSIRNDAHGQHQRQFEPLIPPEPNGMSIRHAGLPVVRVWTGPNVGDIRVHDARRAFPKQVIINRSMQPSPDYLRLLMALLQLATQKLARVDEVMGKARSASVPADFDRYRDEGIDRNYFVMRDALRFHLTALQQLLGSLVAPAKA